MQQCFNVLVNFYYILISDYILSHLQLIYFGFIVDLLKFFFLILSGVPIGWSTLHLASSRTLNVDLLLLLIGIHYDFACAVTSSIDFVLIC